MDKYGYRHNVGIILLNEQDQVLVANRVGKESAWQFPQGGVDAGEGVEQALFRELKEELGLNAADVEVIAQSKDWFSYAIPRQYQRYSLQERCRGQHQKWFLLRFRADDSKICLDDSETPEFDEWRWVDYWSPIELVIEFKREVYQRALNEFAGLIGR